MSDLQGQGTLPVPSDPGQAPAASGQQPPSGEQPSDPGQAAVKKYEENIRNLQSSYDKKLAERDRQYQQQLAATQQLQQRLQAMEDQSAPDDYARMELQLKRAQDAATQYYNAYQQAVEDKRQEQERNQSLREIADEFGVSIRDLDDATDYKSAVRLALRAQQQKAQKQQQDDNDKSNRNMPDLGGGAPRTAGTQAEAEWDELVRTKDSVGQTRWLRLHGDK